MESKSHSSQHPPGTVHLTEAGASWRTKNVVLQPQPSSDPNDPLNWSTARKATNLTIICIYTLICFATISVSGPLWTPQDIELGFNANEQTKAYAANNGALALGCIIFIPLALKYGRRPIYIVSSLLITLFSLWGALQKTVLDMYLSNVFLGLAAATNETLIQLTIADMFFIHQRGAVNSLYLMMVTIGNFLSPVASGYAADSQGWRWAYWWCVILMGVTFVLITLFYEETKFSAPTLEGSSVDYQTQDEKSICKQETVVGDGKIDGSDTSLTAIDSWQHGTGAAPIRAGERRIDTSIPRKSYRQRLAFVTLSPGNFSLFFAHVWQPFVLLALFPAVAFTALQYAASVSWIAVMATTQAILYAERPYNFSPSGIGLLNLPPFIGAVLGSVWGGPLSDKYILWRASRNRGVYEPEMRLEMMLLPALGTPVGLLVYGLTTANGYPWIIPCIGAGILGFGITAISDIVLTFLVDSYINILGDALIGVAFIRNGLSTALVFGITPWMANMGTYNMFVTAGCISFAVTLLCVPMMLMGKKARVWTTQRYAHYTTRQFTPRGF